MPRISIALLLLTILNLTGAPGAAGLQAGSDTDAVTRQAGDDLTDKITDAVRDQVDPDAVVDAARDALPDGVTDAIGTTASDVADSAQQFFQDPSFGAIAAAISVVGGSLLGGLTLWIAGRKVVKGVFALLGAAAGGILGAVILPATGLGAALPVSLPPTWIGLGAGALVGLLLAVAAFRFALAIFAGITGSVLATMIAVVLVGLQYAPTESAEPLTPSELLLEGIPTGNAADQREPTDEAEPEPTSPGLTTEKARAFVSQVVDHLTETYWTPTPVWKRSTVVAAGFFGLLGGLALGVFMPNRSTAVITALAGAGLWIPSAASIALQANAPPHLFERSLEQWLAIWLVASILGMVLQLTLGKRKKKSSKKSDD